MAQEVCDSDIKAVNKGKYRIMMSDGDHAHRRS